VAGGVACASLPLTHRVRMAIQGTSRQMAAAAARAAKVAAVAEGGDDAITTSKHPKQKGVSYFEVQCHEVAAARDSCSRRRAGRSRYISKA
jgi:hypothetical protein